MKRCGIYCIENIVNHKKYIGQSRDIDHRFYTHKQNLNRNTHINRYLQNAWNKYGSNNFSFYVIEICDESQLNEKECMYINLYQTLEHGYNLSLGGQGISGYKHTPEEIEKMIQIQNPEPVYQCDKDLNIIAEWPSASTAAKKLNCSKRQIMNCCNRSCRAKSVREWIFVFKKDWESLDRDYYTINNRSYPIPILQIDINGNVVRKWNSAYEANLELGIHNGEISAVIHNKRNTSHGYFWIKESDYNINDIEKYKGKFIRSQNNLKKVYKYDLQYNLIYTYNSRQECFKQEGFSKSTLEKHLRNHTPYNGFLYLSEPYISNT